MKSLKRRVQTVLRQAGLYQRARASFLYTLYWRVANPSLVEDRKSEVCFYRTALAGFRNGDLIFDVGANQGSKTGTFLRLGARVIAVEPDETNQKILQEMYLKYRFSPKPVIVVGKALSDQCGVESMWIDEPGSAKNTLSQKWVNTLRTDKERFGQALNFAARKEVETTTLEKLFTTHGVPFFIKIDVEGFELSVLRGMKRSVPYLSFEANLPEFKPEGLKCVELLGQLDPEGQFNYVVDCRRGFSLERWLSGGEFSEAFQQCTDKSIEVFWRSSSTSATQFKPATAFGPSKEQDLSANNDLASAHESIEG